jgi:LCP family protein required for cell wall assembly
MRRVQQPVAVGVALLVIAVAGIWLAVSRNDEASIVIGKVDATAAPTPAVTEPGPPEIALGKRFAPDPLAGANSSGPGAALAFRGAVDVPKDLKFFLVIGSDARPGQDLTRSRADSLHIVAVDPLTRKGTIIGLPRDSWVNVPGHGKRKINSALALGGPDLMVKTVRELTGFPISYYAVTAFEGIVKIANTLKGVEVKVPYRMDDRYSGARFEPGWHHMNGEQVLAFSRARHGVPGGDLGRSENQGRIIVHTLEKLRASTKDESGIRKWLGILYENARLDMSMADAVRLGVLARQIVPNDLRNVVAQGSPGSASGQSVVFLSDSAYALFRDVGADAEADGDGERGVPKDPPAGTTPTPKPTPKKPPTPSPTPIVELPI